MLQKVIIKLIFFVIKIVYVIGQVLWAAAEANDPEGGDAVVQSARASSERQDTDHRHWYDLFPNGSIKYLLGKMLITFARRKG